MTIENIPNSDRRKLLAGLGIGGAALMASRCAVPSDDRTNNGSPSDFNFPELPQSLLVNRERASHIMKQAGIDAIICAVPQNIYYLTNYYPQLSKMGIGGFAFAILPVDDRLTPVLVEGQFGFYIAAAETVTADQVDIRLHTGFADADAAQMTEDLNSQLDAAAIPSFLPASHNWHALNGLEENKRAKTLAMSEDMSASSHIALVKALRDLRLTGKSLAVDSRDVKAVLDKADITDVRTNGEHLLRHIRLQKTPAEITLMRYVARANAQAGLAAAKNVRGGASFQDMRQNYAVQCGQRLLTPEFLIIDDVTAEMAPGEIKEGRSFLIDCVSHHQYYHGDYGRTVCVGEPTREIKRATTALGQIWDSLLPLLKPGIFYNEITDYAAEIYAKTDTDAGLVCNPHSVGLNHTDEPSLGDSDYFVKDNLQLVEGMVISVDLPMIETGFGGSAHLEDLVLITADGAELINDGTDRVIIV